MPSEMLRQRVESGVDDDGVDDEAAHDEAAKKGTGKGDEEGALAAD